MIPKNLILIIFTLVVSLIKCFATEQVPDRLIYKGDTLSIFSNPLEQLPYIESLRPKIFDGKEGCYTTACGKGYEAEWIIIKNQLYLIGIYSCCYYKDRIKADLRKLFGNKFVNGKVKADWFTAKTVAPFGKALFYVQFGFGFVYEKELELQFKNGQLISTKTYDNSKSRKSIYRRDEKLREFIYTNINWNILPKLDDKKIKVWVQFSANEKGIIDSVKIIKGYNAIFNREALRVVKAIPNWDIVYQHGKHERMFWKFLVIFSKEMRITYYDKKQ